MYACARRHAADHTIMRSVALIRAAHCLILCINRTEMIVIYMHIIEITSFSVLETNGAHTYVLTLPNVQ